jgi:hypothetical protein
MGTEHRSLPIYTEPLSPPRTRGDCLVGGENSLRPCRRSECRHHMVHPKHSCVLDLADRGGMTLEEVGEVFGLTRERIRQIEGIAFRKLEKRAVSLRD